MPSLLIKKWHKIQTSLFCRPGGNKAGVFTLLSFIINPAGLIVHSVSLTGCALVKPAGKAGLFAGCIVFMQNPLGRRLVNLANSLVEPVFCFFFVSPLERFLEVADRSFNQALDALIS